MYEINFHTKFSSTLFAVLSIASSGFFLFFGQFQGTKLNSIRNFLDGKVRNFSPTKISSFTVPWKKKRIIVVVHRVITKILRSDFAAMHRCVKSEVAFAGDSAAESSTVIPWYHKILIYTSAACLFIYFLSRVVHSQHHTGKIICFFLFLMLGWI